MEITHSWESHILVLLKKKQEHSIKKVKIRRAGLSCSEVWIRGAVEFWFFFVMRSTDHDSRKTNKQTSKQKSTTEMNMSGAPGMS